MDGLTKKVFDMKTGKAKVVPLSDEEIAQRQKDHEAHIAEKQAQEAVQYKKDRRKEFPPVADVVDELSKAMEFIIENLGLENCSEFLQMQQKRNAIKAKYPKEQ